MRLFRAKTPRRQGRKRWAGLLTLAGLLALPIWAQRPSAPAVPVVLITIDTLRADRVGAYGYDKAETPAMDELSRQGVTFENAIVQTPITLPSHASIMTGTYPVYHGLQDVVGRLDENIPTLGEWFQGRGYASGAFVGASVLSANWGLDRGFDHYDDDFSRSSSAGSRIDFDRVERNAEAVVSRAIPWMEKQRNRPFFLWIHLYDPHDPYQPPEPYASRFRQRPYDGEVAYTDAQIKRLFDSLRKLGLYDSSLIVLTADHGEMLGEHGEEHHAFFIYEASLRVPLIIKPPQGRVSSRELAGTRVTTQVRSVDIAATIAQVLGAGVPQWVQGEGLLARMLGRRADNHLPAYAETHYPRVHFGWSPLFSLSNQRHKYIDAPRPELYDLQQDPAELNNIIGDNQAMANRLKEELRSMQARYASRSGKASGDPSEGVDPETLQRLQSLGYVAFSSGTSGDQDDWGGLADPKDKIGTYNRLNQAMRESRLGKVQNAIAILREVEKKEPEMPLVHFSLGLEFAKLKQHLLAIDQFKQTIRYNPGSDVARFNLIRAYKSAGLSDRAIETARQLLERDPKHYAARHLMAQMLGRSGRLKEAVEQEKEVVKQRPDFVDGHNNLGAYLYSSEKYQEAADSYRKALEIAPDHFDAMVNLALTELKLGAIDRALPLTRKAVQLRPRSGLAHYYLGLALRGSGMDSEAQQAFQNAQQLDPNLRVPPR